MKKLLYLSPYFPPISRVGALRPLKFVRHLPDLGWAPIVLCDAWPGAPVDPRLLDKVPDDVIVERDFTRRARSFSMDEAVRTESGRTKPRRTLKSRLPAPVRRWLDNPELTPLSDRLTHIPYSISAAEGLLRQHDVDAIAVNADPYEGIVVGAAVARRHHLPLVLDLRDPWSLCELRRPLRPAPTRWITDRLERRCFETASAIVLNTETALEDYRRAYPDIDPARFSCIRNHSDADLISAGARPDFDRFTVLFLGSFRRFLEGESLLRALALLADEGYRDRLQLVVTGEIAAETRAFAESLGVLDMIRHAPFVSYAEIGATMSAADLLVLVGHRTRQRIPAKLYDYLTTDRRILCIIDNPEISGMLEGDEGVTSVGLDDPAAAAKAIRAEVEGGRDRRVQRDSRPWSSRQAAERLAAILDRVS